MKKVIAQCHTNPNDQLDLTELRGLLPDYDVMYGLEALGLVNSGKLLAKNVLVIQECNSKIARKLRQKGAVALINYCWESQIYAHVYYSKLKQIAPKFKYRVYFKGMFKGLKNCDDKNNFQSYYPGASDFQPEAIDWENREFVSMVLGNKYVEFQNVFPKPTFNIGRYFKWLVRLFFDTKTQKFLINNELQNTRLELIEYFGQKDLLKMHGKGWDNLGELPVHWQTRLEKLIKKLEPKPIENKLKAVSKCKFNFAIENLSYSGYVTEKIIEAMVAKSIPVYHGAPDIEDFIPKGCFIDIRDFESLDALYDYMNSITREQAQSYIDNAQAFLASSEGQKYTVSGFNNFIKRLIKSYEKEQSTEI